MSAAASIRIDRLDLRVARRDRVHAFRNDIEDALRTASLPRLPPGACLTIRRLRLGSIAAGTGRQELSRYLEARITATDYVVALPGAAVPETAEAVLVPDLVVGAALALDAIESGRAVPWYVAGLFPKLSAASPQAAAGRVVAALVTDAGEQLPGRLAEMPGGGPRLIRLIARLHEPAVLAHLDTLQACQPPRAPDLSTTAPTVHVPLEPAPAPPRARRAALEAVARHASPIARREIESAAHLLDLKAEPLALLVGWLAAARAGPPAAAAAVAHFHAALTPPTPQPGGRSSPDPAWRPSEAARLKERGPARMQEAAAAPIVSPPVSEPGDAPLGRRGPEPGEASGLEGELSAHAGLWLLVPALRLVGLDAAEASTGLALGHSLLSGFADRLGLLPADPARTVLAPDDPGDDMHLRSWTTHPEVLRLVAGRRGLEVARLLPGRALIGLHGGRGPLAVAEADQLHMLRRASLRLRIAESKLSSLAPALRRGLTLATQLLVRRSTGKGWRQIARRPGRIRVTATHLDVEFDGRLADPAVRGAGLDLDPGWVPWLGRVVSFHYDYSKVRDCPVPEERQ
jgi:hypothetical protein